MNRTQRSIWMWLALIVVGHLLVSMAHGAVHSQAHVPLSPAATVFVFGVILAGPLVGLALAWRDARTGSWIIAVTMAGALVFGLVNHFVLASPDHVAHVDAQWRSLFTLTAVMLVVTEAAGSALAIQAARQTQRLGDIQPTRT
jgi:hypothetical protein